MNRILPIGTFLMAAAALAVSLTRGTPQTAPAVAEAHEPAVEHKELRALERRVELLEETSGYLERRVFELKNEVGGNGGAATPAVAGAPGTAAAPGSTTAGPTEAPRTVPAEIKMAVRQAQEELATEQRKERFERFGQMQAQSNAAEREKWKKFTGEANLSYSQEQTLQSRLTFEEQQRTALMEQVRAGTKDMGDLRRETRAARQETDKTMTQLLSSDQMQKYTDVRQEDRRQGGGRGGRREGGQGAATALP